MALEIERKFLVKGSFKHLAYESDHVVQGYICSEHGRTVRVRIRAGKGYLTIKGPSLDNGLSRFEWERDISVNDAEQLLKLCVGGVIDKTRYLIKNGIHTIEVDEFHGANDGLIVAEIELNTVDEAYTLPDFLGKEVTGDTRYYNSSLLKHPFNKMKNTFE